MKPALRALAFLALFAAASCARHQPATAGRWIPMGEDADSRASLDARSIRGDLHGVRSVTYVLDLKQVQEVDFIEFDRSEMRLEFDCARHTMRMRSEAIYLRGVLVERMDADSLAAEEEPDLKEALDLWEDVPPGTFVANAMKHVCQIKP